MRVTKGNETYAEGRLTLDTWIKDGESKSGLSVVATRIEVLGRIGKRLPKKPGWGKAKHDDTGGAADFDDAIPF